MPVSGNINAGFNITLTKVVGSLRTASDPLTSGASASLTFTNGTGANQANNLYAATRTLNSAATETLDLAGSLANAFGDTITASQVKGVYIKNTSTTDSLVVGDAASNAWEAWTDDAGSTIKVPPGGVFFLGAPLSGGMPVVGGSSDNLKIAHGTDTTNDLTYTIALLVVES